MYRLRSSENIVPALKHPAKPQSRPGKRRLGDVRCLAGVVVPGAERQRAVQALEELGILVVQVASGSVFSGQGNVTLILGLPEADLGRAQRALAEACKRALPADSADEDRGVGAHSTTMTLFCFEVERFEEF